MAELLVMLTDPARVTDPAWQCMRVDSNGVLYINTDGGTTWQKVGAQ